MLHKRQSIKFASLYVTLRRFQNEQVFKYQHRYMTSPTYPVLIKILLMLFMASSEGERVTDLRVRTS